MAVLPVRVSPPPRPSPRLGSPPWGLPSSPLLSWRGCRGLVLCLVPAPPRGVAPPFVRGPRPARCSGASGSSVLAAHGVCGGGLRVGGGAPSSPRGFRAPPGCGCAAGAYRPPASWVITLVAVGALPWSPAGAGSPSTRCLPLPLVAARLACRSWRGWRAAGVPLSARPLWGFIVARLAVVAVRPSSPPAPVGRGGCGCRWAFRPPAAGAEPAAPFTPRGRACWGRFPLPSRAATLRGERLVAALGGFPASAATVLFCRLARGVGRQRAPRVSPWCGCPWFSSRRCLLLPAGGCPLAGAHAARAPLCRGRAVASRPPPFPLLGGVFHSIVCWRGSGFFFASWRPAPRCSSIKKLK